MGALAFYIEDEGVPTVQISLVREHTAALRPPRALWVPFMLGRPLGVPDDPAFQRRVVMAALRLFERKSGPVLEDYPEDAPAVMSPEELEGTACPISFATPDADVPLVEQVLEEVSQLRSWYDIAVRKRSGRTALGVAGAPVEDLVRYLAAWVDGKEPAPYRPELSSFNAIRLGCEELKNFYQEANAGQPGARSPMLVQQWFWHETAAGKLVIALGAALASSGDREAQMLAQESLLPRIAKEAKP